MDSDYLEKVKRALIMSAPFERDYRAVRGTNVHGTSEDGQRRREIRTHCRTLGLRIPPIAEANELNRYFNDLYGLAEAVPWIADPPPTPKEENMTPEERQNNNIPQLLKARDLLWGNPDFKREYLDAPSDMKKRSVIERYGIANGLRLRQYSRDALNHFFNDYYGMDKSQPFHPLQHELVDALYNQSTNAVPTPNEESTDMNQLITIVHTRVTTNGTTTTDATTVNGVSLKDLSDDQAFNAIAATEAEIKRLEAIEAKPAKLQAKIDGMKATIKELSDLIDAR